MLVVLLQSLARSVAAHPVLVALCLVGLHLCLNRYGSMRDVPGPPLARWTQLYKVYYDLKGTWPQQALLLHDRYGPVVRIAPREAMLADARAAKELYGHNTKMQKSDWYAGWHREGRESLFSTQDSAFHSQRKRKIAHVYTLSNVIQMETKVDEITEVFMARMEEFASRSDAVDIAPWMQMYAFDVIGALSYGEPFGLLSGSMSSEILEAVKTTNDNMSVLGEFPLLHRFANTALFNLLNRLRAPTLTPLLAQLVALPQACITKRSRESIKPGARDMLGILLATRAEKGEDSVSQVEMLGVMLQNIFAGSDTTAGAFRFLLWHVLNHPHIYRTLQAEIDDAEKQGKLSPYVSFAEAQEMPYLCAVIKESLRITPAVGFYLPRIVTSSGFTHQGYAFTPGDVVGIHPWVGNRDPSVYGTDAGEFNPDRWCESRERSVEMDRYLTTFGGGARTCIGKNVSIMELHKLVPQFLRRYTLAWADPSKAPDDQWSVETRQFVYQTNMMIKLTKRSSVH